MVDLGTAHLLAVDYLQMGGNSVALNLGTGEGYSVKQVIAAVEEVTGRRVPVRICGRRSGDPPVLVASCGMAHRTLGWTAERPLKQVIESAWRWMDSSLRKSILVDATRSR